MSYLTRMWFGMLTQASEHSETDSSVVAIVTLHGEDLLHHTFPDTPQSDQGRGEANLYSVDVTGRKIHSADLEEVSVRLGIRGSDMWRLEKAAVWGEDTEGLVLPIAFGLGADTPLSTDAKEGEISVPILPTGLGRDSMPIWSLLMLMTTSTARYAGTNSLIELDVTTRDGRRVVHHEIPETPQSDQERGQANLYLLGTSEIEFHKEHLGPESISLRIRGDDLWLPASFFLFGVFRSAGRWSYMMPLVHLPTWPYGAMSTDSSEGRAEVLLEIA